MMDYYEELGVDRAASTDEIRQAYKRLVRLLHPDRCADEHLRPLAELQVKRLNEVLGVLTSVQERARYDHGLSSNRRVAWRRDSASPNYLRRYWPIAGTLTVLALALVLARVPQTAAPEVADDEHLTDTPAPIIKDASPRDSRHLPPAKPDNKGSGPDVSWIPLEGGVPATLTLPYSGNPHGSESADRSEEVQLPAHDVLEAPRPRPNEGFAGEWLFAPSPRSRISGVYVPDYIELRVIEAGGMLRGRYRARYHVPDRAISPAVAFEFEGRAGTDEANVPWRGNGGAKGEVRLRLVAPGTLEVTWMARELGEMGLISGTAVLTRQLE